MRFTILLISLVMLLGHTCTARAQSNSKVIKAFESGFNTSDDFKAVYQFILPSDDDTTWRQVPWIPSLWQGMQIAAKNNKPMFIWAMNGDPLGCV
jgi:hypothetical protein